MTENKIMGKGNREIKNHVEQAVTFDRLVELLGLDEIVELQPSAEQLASGVKANSDAKDFIHIIA